MISVYNKVLIFWQKNRGFYKNKVELILVKPMDKEFFVGANSKKEIVSRSYTESHVLHNDDGEVCGINFGYDYTDHHST